MTVPFLYSINDLREGKWIIPGNAESRYKELITFEQFFDRAMNLEQVFYYNRYDRDEWFQTLTECIDKGVPPKGFDFFIERDKIDILSAYLAFKELGLKSLILRQQFPPEQDFDIDDEEILNNTDNAPIEPFSYLLLYKQSDIAQISDKQDTFVRLATNYKEQLLDNKELEKQVNGEQLKYWIYLSNQNEKTEEYKKGEEDYLRRTNGTRAYFRARAATAPWIDPWREPRYNYRATIIYGNPNYKGTIEDLNQDALKEIDTLKELKQVKQKIKSNKLKGR